MYFFAESSYTIKNTFFFLRVVRDMLQEQYVLEVKLVF